MSVKNPRDSFNDKAVDSAPVDPVSVSVVLAIAEGVSSNSLDN
jgi:hypothetical protein